MDTPVESKSQDRSLTTTSYAVLCVLALREHSTYDLIAQMRRSMHYMWPRAESNVYAEPKRLVDAGLATAREEWTGNRKRTIYGLTPRGREELARWFASPSSHQRYESEALVKLLFAENGTVEDAISAVESLRADAQTVIDHFLGIADEYDAGEGQYPGRFALSAISARLLLDQQKATLRWAEWAHATLRSWADVRGPGSHWGVEAIRASGSADPSP